VKKFKITSADGQILHVYRRWYDVFTEGWSIESMGYISFRFQNSGKRVKIQKHWIIMIEEE